MILDITPLISRLRDNGYTVRLTDESRAGTGVWLQTETSEAVVGIGPAWTDNVTGNILVNTDDLRIGEPTGEFEGYTAPSDVTPDALYAAAVDELDRWVSLTDGGAGVAYTYVCSAGDYSGGDDASANAHLLAHPGHNIESVPVIVVEDDSFERAREFDRTHPGYWEWTEQDNA